MPIGTLNSNNGLSKRMDQTLGTDPMNPSMNDLTVRNLKVTGTVTGVSLSADGTTSNEDFTGTLEGAITGTQKDTQIAENVVDTQHIVNSAITKDKLSDDINDLLDKIGTLEAIINGQDESKDFENSEDPEDPEASRSINIASSRVTLAPNDVSTRSIRDGAVTTSKLADRAVTTVKIASGAVGLAQLSKEVTDKLNEMTGSTGVPTLADGSVTTAKLASKAVTSAQLADKAVTSAQLADKAVTSAQLADKAVTSAQLADNSVTSAQLADNSVTTSELANGAVTTAKLADNSVTSAQIADKAVGTSELADAAVTTAKLASKAVTSAQIADKTITAAQIADGVIPSSVSVSPESVVNAIKSSTLPSLRFEVASRFESLNIDERSRTVIPTITLPSEPISKTITDVTTGYRLTEYSNSLNSLETAYTDIGNLTDLNYTTFPSAPTSVDMTFYGALVDSTTASTVTNANNRIFTFNKFTRGRTFAQVYTEPQNQTARPADFVGPTNINFNWGVAAGNIGGGKAAAFVAGDHVISGDGKLFLFKSASEVVQVELSGLNCVILETRASTGAVKEIVLCTYDDTLGIRRYNGIDADNFDAVAAPGAGTSANGNYKIYISNATLNEDPIIGIFSIVANPGGGAVADGNLTAGNDTFAFTTTGFYTLTSGSDSLVARVFATTPGRLTKITTTGTSTLYVSGTILPAAAGVAIPAGSIGSTNNNNVLFRLNNLTVIRETSKSVTWGDSVMRTVNASGVVGLFNTTANILYRRDITGAAPTLIQIAAQADGSTFRTAVNGLYVISGFLRYYEGGLVAQGKVSPGTFLNNQRTALVTVADDSSISILNIVNDAISYGFPRSVRVKADANATYATPALANGVFFLDFDNRMAYRTTAQTNAGVANSYSVVPAGNYRILDMINPRGTTFIGLNGNTYDDMVITVDSTGKFVPMGTGEPTPYTICFNTTTSRYLRITANNTVPLLSTTAHITNALALVWDNRIKNFDDGTLVTTVSQGWYASQSNLYYVDSSNITGSLVAKNPSVNGKVVEKVFVDASDLVYTNGKVVNYTNGDVIAVNTLGLRVYFTESDGFRPV